VQPISDFTFAVKAEAEDEDAAGAVAGTDGEFAVIGVSRAELVSAGVRSG